MRHVSLVGFMASGKTTLGKRLARALSLPFVDTDALITSVHGEIHTIFRNEGEGTFREYELQAVHGALSGPPSVIAPGGGAVTHAPTLALLETRSHMIHLRVEPKTVFDRLKGAKEIRPMLGEQPTVASIEALYETRRAFYERAGFSIAVDTMSATSLVGEIVQWLSTREPLLIP